jgi:hypothetical protein
VIQNHGDSGLEIVFGAFVSLNNNVTIQRNANFGAVVGGSELDIFGPNTTIQNNSGDGVILGGNAKLLVSAGNVIARNGGHGVSVGNLSFARFDPGTVGGNLTSPDVLCFQKFPATHGALANLGGTTNCTEP